MSGHTLRSLSIVAMALAAAPLHAETFKVKAGELIQDAINAAALNEETGDVISVAKGLYPENLVILESGLTLKGSSATINGRYQGNCISVEADDVTIQGLILVNGGGLPPTDGVPSGGLLATGSGIQLSKLTISGCADWGIRLVGDGTVENCKVSDCTEDGISASSTAGGTVVATVINKNTVSRCDTGIRLDDGPFTVTSNTCTSNEGDGIEVNISLPLADGAIAAGTTLSKNKSIDSGETGIIVFNPSGAALVLLEKNTMDRNDVGCLLEGALIDAKSNTIQNSRFEGLVIEASDCNLEKNTVKNNAGIGIIVDGTSNSLTSNTLQGNGEGGISVFGDESDIMTNTVKDSVGDGIEIEIGAENSFVHGNKVSGNDHEGIDNSGLLTILHENNSKTNGGFDIAGRGDGTGTVVAEESTDNIVSDESDLDGFTTVGVLDLH